MATIEEAVVAPGQTVALVELAVRAPFDGTLTAFDVVEGAPVRRGQRVGEIIARDSEAALSGAEQLVRLASSPTEAAEASRALELARTNLVSAPLTAAADGVVTQRSAARGDRVSGGDQLLTIVETGSLVFRANVVQSDLTRIRAGQAATVALAGEVAPLAGQTKGLLPAGTTADFTVPLRIDFAAIPPGLAVGRMGTARIIVAVHPNVPLVPLAALLRDDLTGVTRLGTVGPGDVLRWVDVQTGLADGQRVEITAPALAEGALIVVSGQVGLPDGTVLVYGSESRGATR